MIMQSFTELIDTKQQFLELLDSLGVRHNGNNRWIETYRLVEELEKARLNGTIDDIDRVTMGRMRFALLDLSELSNILDSIREDDDKLLLKGKFELLLSGIADRTKETDSNTVARDTQLELVLNASFRKAKLESAVTDPHPDVVINVDTLQFGVECKRVFSPNANSVVRAVRNASTQLRKYYLDDGRAGIVAIGIDRHLTGGDKILDSGSELSARVFLSHEIEEFVYAYSRRWSKTDIIGDERVAGVLVYMSLVGIVQQENIPIHATQMGITHCFWTLYGKQNFASLKHDVADPLIRNAGEMNDYVRAISEAGRSSK